MATLWLRHNYYDYLKYNKHLVIIFVIMFDPSLLDLANFLPKDDTEVIIVGETVVTEYMAYSKEMWSNRNYWLGGQVKLSLTEKITDVLMDKVRKVNVESGDYACDVAAATAAANPLRKSLCFSASNSWEMASIQRSQRQFSEIIVVVKRYREVMRRRVLAELEKTPLNADVNGVIMSLCG